jgi:periplasmic protein TonB
MSHLHTARVRAARLALALALAYAGTALASDDLKLLSRVDPEYPREAMQAGVDRGRVKARMTVDGSGEVVRVEILEASPRRVFDRAVVRTLSQWKFNRGGSARSMEVDIDFSR